jgi:hypothetical protein
MPGVFTPGQTISTPGGTFTTPGHMSGGGMSTSEDLGTVVHFIIWDYQKNCEVAYGALNVKTAFAFGMTRSTWRKAFSNIATEIFKETPFKFKDLKTRW